MEESDWEDLEERMREGRDRDGKITENTIEGEVEGPMNGRREGRERERERGNERGRQGMERVGETKDSPILRHQYCRLK